MHASFLLGESEVVALSSLLHHLRKYECRRDETTLKSYAKNEHKLATDIHGTVHNKYI